PARARARRRAQRLPQRGAGAPRVRTRRVTRADMKRTVVAHGTVAAPYGVFSAHVVVEGERIVALGDDDSLLAGADEVVDAEGLHALPGAVDPHVHYEDLGHAERA